MVAIISWQPSDFYFYFFNGTLFAWAPVAHNRAKKRGHNPTTPVCYMKVSKSVEPKSKIILKPLIAAAALSVATFSSIGVAAITGHLQIAKSNLNPFASSHVNRTQSVEAITVHATHRGLTRRAGQIFTDGQPLDFRPGKRVPARKVECDSCGVIDSIQAREALEENLHAPPVIKHVSLQAGPAVTDRGFVVTVRMEDGSVRTILETQRPAFSIGERVQLVNGTVIPLG